VGSGWADGHVAEKECKANQNECTSIAIETDAVLSSPPTIHPSTTTTASAAVQTEPVIYKPVSLDWERRCQQFLSITFSLHLVQHLWAEIYLFFVPQSPLGHLLHFSVAMSLQGICIHVVHLSLQESSIHFQNFHHVHLSQVYQVHMSPHHISVPSRHQIHIPITIGLQIYSCYQI
jgi:hypothetical protein